MAERAGHAAHHGGADGAAAVRADHDEVGVDIVRSLLDERRGVLGAGAYLEPRVEASRPKLCHLVLELVPDVGLVGEERRATGPARERLVPMNGDDAGAVGLRELPDIQERAVRELGPVGCPNDGLEHDVRPFLDTTIVDLSGLDRIGRSPASCPWFPATCGGLAPMPRRHLRDEHFCMTTGKEEPKMTDKRPILFATDGSPSATQAQKQAFELAQRLDAPSLVVSVAHVTLPVTGYPAYGYSNIVAELTEAEHHRVTALLASVAEAAEAEGVHCSTVAADGFRRRGDLPQGRASTTRS